MRHLRGESGVLNGPKAKDIFVLGFADSLWHKLCDGDDEEEEPFYPTMASFFIQIERSRVRPAAEDFQYFLVLLMLSFLLSLIQFKFVFRY